MSGPVKTFRCQNVSVAIFKSDTGQFNIKLSASYKPTGSSEWKYTDSLGAKDALVGAHLLKKAAEWVMENDTPRPDQRQRKPATSTLPPFKPDKPARDAGPTLRGSDLSPDIDDEFADSRDSESDIPF